MAEAMAVKGRLNVAERV